MALTSRVPGYEITEVIHEAENTTVYRAKSHKNNQKTILKVVKPNFVTLEQINRLKHEFKICENLNLEGVVKVYGLENCENWHILVMEDFDGISLKDFVLTHTLSLEIFLLIALQLAESLASLHGQHIIHKDIKPSNIIINPQTLQVKITDFSIASMFQDVEIDNSTQLEGTLLYISPEQTGRINRKVDYRTDFYSLGVTFYELLTGQLPFVSNDPLEMVYAHTAKQPIPIRELSQKLSEVIPEDIASIITKLMAKNPDARYQSAFELLSDLYQCLDNWKATDDITDTITKYNYTSNNNTYVNTSEISSTTSKEILDLATVIKATQAISSEIVLDKLLMKLLHIIIENASAQIGCIILERDNDLFIEVADINQNVSVVQLQSTSINNSSDIPISIVEHVVTTKKPLVLTDASQEGIFIKDPYILQKQPKSILCTPIFYQNRFLGLVYLENNHYTGAFTQERLEILHVITSQAAIAIENARLFSAEQQKSQQLVESLNQLAQQEQQYRTIFENTIDALAIYDLETSEHLLVNQALCKMYGYDASEWLHLQPSDFLNSDSYHVFAHFLSILNDGKEYYSEAVIRCKDGTLIDVEIKATPILYNHKRCALIVSHDITKRKQAEKAVIESEHRYRNLVEASQDMICSIDTSGYFSFVNSAVSNILGYQPEEIIGRPFTDFQPEDQHQQDYKVFQRILAGESYLNYETKYSSKYGDIINLSFNAIVLRDQQGNFIGVTATGRDITQHKRSEDLLKKNEQQLRTIYDGVSYPIFINDIGADGKIYHVSWNNALLKASGMQN
jgi:PAS domain S-box-containing protein